MGHAIAIPKLGLTMVDCTLVEWAKADGDKVVKGEVLYTIETDKIASDVEADADGYLQRTAEVDAMFEVGAVIGYLHGSKEAASRPAAATSASVVPVQPAPQPVPTSHAPAPVSSPSLRVDLEGGRTRILISPVAKRLASEARLDLAMLSGTGPGAVILRRDVERAIAVGPGATIPAPTPTAKGSLPEKGDAIARRRPLAGMRKAIATRMMQSLQGSAQMTGFGRIDMSETVKLRAACLAAEKELGARITYTDIVLKAAAMALAEMPDMNSSIVGDEVLTWNAVNIGLAIALDDGLIVPVIRDTDRKSLAEISLDRQGLIARARSGKLTRDDLDGGTFSLSNFGSYGGDFETPILNPPQSALLGIGQITDEPVVREGQIVVRPMLTISLTFDHRLIDGAVAGRFRARLKGSLENPALLLAKMR